ANRIKSLSVLSHNRRWNHGSAFEKAYRATRSRGVDGRIGEQQPRANGPCGSRAARGLLFAARGVCPGGELLCGPRLLYARTCRFLLFSARRLLLFPTGSHLLFSTGGLVLFTPGSLVLRTAGCFLLFAAGRAGRAGDDGVHLSRHLAL